MWTILCAEETVDQHRFLLLPKHLNAASEPERRRIDEHAMASIAPRLVVRPGADWGSRLRQQELSPIESCAHLKVLAGDDDERHFIEPVLKDRRVLARFAETLTGYLEHALSLLKEVDGVTLSVGYRPSIAEHHQNSGPDNWTHLIDLVRDSHVASYWPSEGQRNTAATADEMMKLVMESGRAFPDAVSWSLAARAVQPIRGLLRLHRLLEQGYHYIREHPDAVLRLLAGVVTQESIIDDDRHFILRPILEDLEATNAALTKEPEFQRLQRFANQ